MSISAVLWPIFASLPLILGQSCSRLHEVAPSLPSGWTFDRAANRADSISLNIALTHAHENYLDLASEVSDPNSPQYGKHATAEELANLLPNYQNQAEEVHSWLSSAGIDDAHIDGEWVNFHATVGQANALLNASFAYYSLHDSDPTLRTQSYSIPCQLANSIDFVYPTVHFMKYEHKSSISKKQQYSKRQHVPPAIVNCTNSVCPETIKKQYNITYVPPNGTSESTIGIAGFLEQYINRTDVETFLTNFTGQSKGSTYHFAIDNLGKVTNNESNSGLEASLDVEYASAFTRPLNLTFFSVPGRPPTLKQPGGKSLPRSKSMNEPYMALLQHLASLKSPPQVLSLSYSDTESTVPIKFAMRVCNLYGRLALRGMSVIHSSGDGGATGTVEQSDCIAPDGKDHRFAPTFPASCKWVTSVGALMQSSQPYAASYSSGGFSNYFGIPDFQRNITTKYQDSLKKPAGYFNHTGRGIPDVALMGDDFVTVSGGFAQQASGTSAAAPVFAAMIALINDKRLRSGKPVLGHLNPLLYSAKLKDAITDVTRGSSAGCNYKTGSNYTLISGYPATKGWDAVTGLGAPDFAKMLDLLS